MHVIDPGYVEQIIFEMNKTVPNISCVSVMNREKCLGFVSELTREEFGVLFNDTLSNIIMEKPYDARKFYILLRVKFLENSITEQIDGRTVVYNTNYCIDDCFENWMVNDE